MELTRLLVVSDIERSTSWYRDVLGATVEREYGGTSLVLRFLGSWVVAVLPNVLAAGTLFAYLRFLRMADELIRLIQLQGLGTARNGPPPQDAALVVPTFGMVFGTLYSAWRYR